MKKILLSLIMLIVSLSFLGCANIEASVTYMKSGQIVQRVKVTISQTEVEALGLNYTSFYNKVYSVMFDEAQALDLSYNTDIGILSRSGTEGLKKAIVYGRANDVTVIKEANTIVATKEFNNVYAFLYFNYRENMPEKFLVGMPMDGQIDEVSDLLTVTYIQECLTLFDGQDIMINRVLQKLNTEFSQGLSLSDATLSFKYSTPFRRVHTDGQTSKQGNYYVHTWNITDASNTVNISRTAALPTMWYALALGIIVGLVVIIALFMWVKDKNKKPPLAFEKVVDVPDTPIIKEEKTEVKVKKQTTSKTVQKKTPQTTKKVATTKTTVAKQKTKKGTSSVSIDDLSMMLHQLNTNTVPKIQDNKKKNSKSAKK